jgi:hypothetical protein
MKKSPVSKIISTLIAIFVLVAIFVMFSDCFYSTKYSTVFGSCFDVMFALNLSDTYEPVIPLIVAFASLVTIFILTFGGFVLEGKSLSFLYVVETAILIAVGVIFLFAVKFEEAAQNISLSDYSEGSLGAGSICVVVFSFLGAATGIIGLLANKKQEA